MKKQKNVVLDRTLLQYQEKYGNGKYNVAKYTIKEVEDFDKKYGHYVFDKVTHELRYHRYLLRGSKWWLIDGTYYEVPRGRFNKWWHNRNPFAKFGLCTAGVVVLTAAIATPTVVSVFYGINYTITYDLNNGYWRDDDAKKAPTTYRAGDDLTRLLTPSRTNYDFVCWKDTKSGIEVGEVGAGRYGNLNLKAEWVLHPYLISYTDSNGNLISKGSYTVEDEFDLPTNILKPGYTKFVKWEDKENPGTPVTKINKNTTGDKTFKGTWSDPETYTINFFKEDGVSKYNSIRYTVETETFALSNKEAEIGLTVDPGKTYSWYQKGTSNVVETIKQGSLGSMDLQIKFFTLVDEIKYNTYISSATTPTKTGFVYGDSQFDLERIKDSNDQYMFVDWYTDKTGGDVISSINPSDTKYQGHTKITENLHARWARNIDLSYDPQTDLFVSPFFSEIAATSTEPTNFRYNVRVKDLGGHKVQKVRIMNDTLSKMGNKISDVALYVDNKKVEDLNATGEDISLNKAYDSGDINIVFSVNDTQAAQLKNFRFVFSEK